MTDKSKSKNIPSIKGIKDILPDEARKWQKVESVAKKIFESSTPSVAFVRSALFSVSAFR